MELLYKLLQDPIFQMVASAAISWIFNKAVDPSPSDTHARYPNQTPVGNLNPSTEIMHSHAEDIGRAVEDALRRHHRKTRGDFASGQQESGAVFAIGFFIISGGAVLLTTYGTIVVDVVRWLVFLTGFSVIFSMFHGYRSGLFRERHWAIRTTAIVVACVLSFIAAQQADNNIQAWKQHGGQLRNIKDFFDSSNAGLLFIYQVVVLVFVLQSAILSLLAQTSMLLNAYAQRNPLARNWRISLYRTIPNWASGGKIVFLLVLGALAFALAAGWFRNLLQY